MLFLPFVLLLLYEHGRDYQFISGSQKNVLYHFYLCLTLFSPIYVCLTLAINNKGTELQ